MTMAMVVGTYNGMRGVAEAFDELINIFHIQGIDPERQMLGVLAFNVVTQITR